MSDDVQVIEEALRSWDDIFATDEPRPFLLSESLAALSRLQARLGKLEEALREGETLADTAARAVSEPRRNLESADAQGELSQAIARFRLAARAVLADAEKAET